MHSARVVEVAVFAPLRKTFHYLADNPEQIPGVGTLVKVPFGRGQRFGVVLGTVKQATDRELKSIQQVVDDEAVVGAQIMRLAKWAAQYYQHPIGDVLAATLPGTLRQAPVPERKGLTEWTATKLIDVEADPLIRNAPRQAALLRLLQQGSKIAADFDRLDFDWRRAIRELENKGLASKQFRQHDASGNSIIESPIRLNDAQLSAVTQINAASGTFTACLLHGVTGSGKTEVYMAAIEHALSHDSHVLMLVPEIILTQQMVARLTQRFGSAVGVLHSGLSDSQRAQVWLQCREGEIRILMGTRSAIWAPLPSIGLIIVDEEHDGSFKQQEGFRYSARDIAVKRAQQLGIPIVLGTATPSLEAYRNVVNGKFRLLTLPERVGTANMPKLQCIDVRGVRLRGGLSDRLCDEMRACLGRGEQVLLFLNRRGFAPTVLCHQCGHVATCHRCDATLVWHKERRILSCHHCGAQKKTERIEACCPEPDLVPIGLGTEQVEETLGELFPNQKVARIDRDTMRRRSVMEKTFADVRSGIVNILIGTQMLAKGHDFPKVSLVGIIDADSQLFSTDFRAEEKLAQTIVQVSGRAGRAEFPGTVFIQTHHPHHQLLQTLLTQGYDAFARTALEERRHATLPPYAPMALIRAESPNAKLPIKFLQELARGVKALRISGLEILGPIPAAMEKRAGRYRAQVILTATSRRILAASVSRFVETSEAISMKSKVRWSIDIDPLDTL